MKKIFVLMMVIFVCMCCSSEQEKKGMKILFIGDSITDGNWGTPCGYPKSSSERNQQDLNHLFGSGYMYLCAANLSGTYPERSYVFFNRGISGNTLADLETRWCEDALDLNPDVISILIGTNDVEMFLNGNDSLFNFEEWEGRYRLLLDRSLEQNKQMKFVICGPFVAQSGWRGESDNWALRDSLVRRCSDISNVIANDYGCVFLPYQSLLDDLLSLHPETSASYWIWDGVHPTPAFHQRMSDLWIEKTKVLLK